MKIEDIMKADEKFVKSSESEAKKILANDRSLIRPVAIMPLSGKPKGATGWSIGEVNAAGLTRRKMRSLHLRIDKFRRTVHEDNVQLLKKIKATSFLDTKK